MNRQSLYRLYELHELPSSSTPNRVDSIGARLFMNRLQVDFKRSTKKYKIIMKST